MRAFLMPLLPPVVEEGVVVLAIVDGALCRASLSLSLSLSLRRRVLGGAPPPEGG